MRHTASIFALFWGTIALFCAGLPARSAQPVDSATEDLLLIRSSTGDPGRMWPGFAAGERGGGEAQFRGGDPQFRGGEANFRGGDPQFRGDRQTGTEQAKDDPEPVNLSTAGLPSTTSLTMPGQGSGLFSSALPSSGTAGLSGFGSGASSLLGMSGLGQSGTGSLSSGSAGLSSILGMLGSLSVLNSLSQMISSLPQQLMGLVQGIAGMVGNIAQMPQQMGQSLASSYSGLMGNAGSLLQTGGDMVGRGGGSSQGGSEPPTSTTTTPATPSSPVIIGVHHADPVSSKTIASSLKRLSKMGYKTFGVEMPPQQQAGIDAFSKTYRETKDLAKSKAAFWQATLDYFHSHPSEFGGVMSADDVRQMDLTGIMGIDQGGWYEGMFDRMALANDLGMSVKAIDAPQALTQSYALKISQLQDQLTSHSITYADYLSSVKSLGSQRNVFMASSITPGMVVEIGASHTGGAGSVDNLLGRAGLNPVTFDAFSKATSSVVQTLPGETVVNSPPGGGFLNGLFKKK